jgi:hypothetical protein
VYGTQNCFEVKVAFGMKHRKELVLNLLLISFKVFFKNNKNNEIVYLVKTALLSVTVK